MWGDQGTNRSSISKTVSQGIQGWQERLLSHAGKNMIKTVAQTIPPLLRHVFI
jgi:hypothetical protein